MCAECIANGTFRVTGAVKMGRADGTVIVEMWRVLDMPTELTMSVEKQVKTTNISVIQDDITLLKVDAFAFYAQHDLVLGTGFGTAISTRGGPKIQEELKDLGPLETGQAVVSGAGKLNANYIIHAVGPRFLEEDLEAKLHETTKNTLACAEEKGVERLALPAMGSGFYGIPMDLCARVMIEVIKEHLGGETSLKEVILCVLDPREYDPMKAALADLG